MDCFFIPEPPPVTNTIRSVSGKSPTVILDKKYISRLKLMRNAMCFDCSILEARVKLNNKVRNNLACRVVVFCVN